MGFSLQAQPLQVRVVGWMPWGEAQAVLAWAGWTSRRGLGRLGRKTTEAAPAQVDEQ